MLLKIICFYITKLKPTEADAKNNLDNIHAFCRIDYN